MGWARTAIPALCAAMQIVVASPGRAEDASAPEKPEETLATMLDVSRRIATTYLAAWSRSDGAALSGLHDLYAPRIDFYGRFTDQRSLYAEKRRFVARWPVRRYAHRPGTMEVHCDLVTQACLVRSVIDWSAANPARRTRVGGSSSFELGIDFAGPQPVVLAERGRVIARR